MLFIYLLIYFCRCGLRGGYIELVGLSDRVKSRIKTYMTARSCPSTIGQVQNKPQFTQEETYRVETKGGEPQRALHQ